MYLLTTNFLYESEFATTLKFSKGSSVGSFYDLNNRCQEIKFLDNDRYELLSDLGFEVRTPDLNITFDGVYKMIPSKVVINGLRYYTSIGIKFIYQIVSSDFRANLVYSSGDSIYILLDPNLCRNWTWTQYIEFINNSPMLFVKDYGVEEFKLVNFDSVDTTYSNNYSFNTNYDFKYSQIGVNEADVISGFIDYLKNEFKSYTFLSELNDLANRSQKQNIIFYESTYGEASSEVSTRIIRHPLYNRIIQTTININFEYLSDDLESYLKFRDCMLMGEIFHPHTSFILKVNDSLDWKYSIDWNYEFNIELDRTPKEKYLEDTQLYSYEFSCRVIGFLVRDIVNYPRIMYPSLNFIVDNDIINIYSNISKSLFIYEGDQDFSVGYEFRPAQISSFKKIDFIEYDDSTNSKLYESNTVVEYRFKYYKSNSNTTSVPDKSSSWEELVIVSSDVGDIIQKGQYIINTDMVNLDNYSSTNIPVFLLKIKDDDFVFAPNTILNLKYSSIRENYFNT